MTNEQFKIVKKRHKKTFEDAIKIERMDMAFEPLCRFISEQKNYFTSSSCSGRIMLLSTLKDENKKDAHFHKKWHSTVKIEELWEWIEKKTTGVLWFKVNPLILHIGCVDLEKAKKILEIMKLAGIKRGGIIVVKKDKILIEFQGSQEMSLPVKEENQIIIEKKFMKKMLEYANKKIEKNYKQLEKLEKIMRQELN